MLVLTVIGFDLLRVFVINPDKILTRAAFTATE